MFVSESQTFEIQSRDSFGTLNQVFKIKPVVFNIFFTFKLPQ